MKSSSLRPSLCHEFFFPTNLFFCSKSRRHLSLPHTRLLSFCLLKNRKDGSMSEPHRSSAPSCFRNLKSRRSLEAWVSVSSPGLEPDADPTRRRSQRSEAMCSFMKRKLHSGYLLSRSVSRWLSS